MKCRIALGFMLLLVIVGSAHANTSCNGASATLTKDDKFWNAGNQYIVSETQTWTVTCVNENNGTGTANGTAAVTASGSGGQPPSGPFTACNPIFSHTYGVSSTAPTSGQNYFEAIGQDNQYGTTGIINPTGTCTGGALHTSFSYCPYIFCAPGTTPTDNPSCDLGTGTDGSNADGCSPIILDIDGKGFNLTSAAGGVFFDISATGHPVQMGWTAMGADNAFLALPAADGLVHNGKQLFGNFTPQPPSQNPNGFAALAIYDDPKNGGNGNGMIDPGDAIYSSLRLWIDANHDGICQPEELHTLASLGVQTISLHYTLSERVDQYGNHFRDKAAVDANAPDSAHVGRSAYDVFFVSIPTGSSKNLIPPAPRGMKQCPVVSTKDGMLSTRR